MAPKKKPEVEQKVLLGRPKNTLKMGLVGLPNVGKSTTFNLLAKQSAPAENFPFCTIDAHEARMSVPDDRFDWLCDHFKPKNEVSAHLTIFDIAGLVPNAHLNEGMGNSFLSHIAAVDGLYHVVRAFDNDEIIHTQGEVNPVKDLQTIADELRFKDIQNVTKTLQDQQPKRGGTLEKSKIFELEVLQRVKDLLETDQKWVSQLDWKAAEVEVLNMHHFLTAKPVVYLVNISESDFLRQKNKWLTKISQWVKDNVDGCIVPYSAEFENKMSDFQTDEEKQNYLKDTGAKQSMLNKIINTGYSALHLLHFYTCGEDEVKCWTIRDGTKAPQAGGVIHTDFEKAFICAEVYKYEDLKQEGSERAVKDAGKLKQKGKDYTVEDGDIILFRVGQVNAAKK